MLASAPSRGRSAFLVVNSDKPDAANAAHTVRDLIQRHGTLVGETTASSLPPPPNAANADTIVVLGGDGTLLWQARRFLHLAKPLLGVNLGRFGFMAEFDLASLTDQAPRLFGTHPLQTHDAPLLRVRVRRAPASAHLPPFDETALNEAVITAGPPYRLVSLAMTIDDRPGPSISGDGLIVSTALGSTAYNLSAGGPIISPMTDAMCVTAIAPFSLAFRPIVLPMKSNIDIRATHVNEPPPLTSTTTPTSTSTPIVDIATTPTIHLGTTLVLDGQRSTPIATNDLISITKHHQAASFVANTESDYWQRLVGKLHWAAEPKLRTKG
jgi:NAD+ kinase